MNYRAYLLVHGGTMLNIKYYVHGYKFNVNAMLLFKYLDSYFLAWSNILATNISPVSYIQF